VPRSPHPHYLILKPYNGDLGIFGSRFANCQLCRLQVRREQRGNFAASRGPYRFGGEHRLAPWRRGRRGGGIAGPRVVVDEAEIKLRFSVERETGGGAK